jgi:peptidoglycan/xylan/chitin deacetylase (PgdA/CDA1 family)
MKICFASIDVEPDLGEAKAFKGIDNLDKILKVFNKYDIKATLFVTGTVLERYGQKLKALLSKNYEIACHSFSHRFWNDLNSNQRKEELEKFFTLYQGFFYKKPEGFRAPSHVIDVKALQILQEKGFLYDSSILPRYPLFKSYRGYKGKALSKPYFPSRENYKTKGEMKILEIPVSGLAFGIPLAGTWISKLPFFVYRILFFISNPVFLTLNLHSWDSLNPNLLEKLDKIIKILKNKNYQFLTGREIYGSISKNR